MTDLLDDLAFWLAVGILASGLIVILVPPGHIGNPGQLLAHNVFDDDIRVDARLCHSQYAPGACHSKGGRPPYDAVLMFKVLVLQHLFNLSGDQTEFQIQDRYSFCRFLGLSPEAKVPDAKTVWVYRKRLRERGLVDKLFSELLIQIDAAGFSVRKGQIVDAAIAPVPRRRNTREENRQIKDGGSPEAWGDNKRHQKNVEAL